MPKITVELTVECSEKNHLEVSSFVKNMMHAMDMAIEGRYKDSDVRFKVEGAHPEAVTTNADPHPLRKMAGI